MSLPTIPIITDQTSVIEIIKNHPDHFSDMIDACYQAADEMDSTGAFPVTDALSSFSLLINSSQWAPYRGEFDLVVDAIAELRDGDPRGAKTILLTDEWGCSTRSFKKPNGDMVMERILDIQPHVGHLPICAIREGESGKYADITFPGLIGSAQAMGTEFAGAVHVAPTHKTLFGKAFGQNAVIADFLVEKLKSVTSRGMSPTVLLRKTFEEAKTAEQAVEMLAETPLTTPIIFHVSGKDSGYVIERQRKRAEVHVGPNVCGTNTWQNDVYGDAWSKPHAPYPVTPDTTGEARLAYVQSEMTNPDHDVKSRLNPEMGRLYCVMNVREGLLTAQGMEGSVEATEVLEYQL